MNQLNMFVNNVSENPLLTSFHSQLHILQENFYFKKSNIKKFPIPVPARVVPATRKLAGTCNLVRVSLRVMGT